MPAPAGLTPESPGAGPGGAALPPPRPPAPADDDAALLARAAAGDASAFDRLVRRHQAAVLRFVHALGCDGADAEDALQEAFVAAWRAAGRYQGTGTVRSWLLSVARNAVRHQRRRRVGEPTHLVPLDALAADAGWGADPRADADERRLLARDALAAALRRLPPDERAVLVLRELEGLDGAEAAAVLHLSLPAMKSRLHRARLHLAAALRASRSRAGGAP